MHFVYGLCNGIMNPEVTEYRLPLPAQSFSGPSPLGLETVFYCLRFETSLFVASYDSQGHGGLSVSSYNSSARTPRKTVSSYQECVFIGSLPSNGYPIVENITPRMCLPSRCLSMVICVISHYNYYSAYPIIIIIIIIIITIIIQHAQESSVLFQVSS
jgi:hypothetical protein